ncbi:MAG: dihydrolipoamide acetyltransferase family protein [Anaerolineae bacterium]
MPTNVIMPQLGESVVEGTVSRWLKQVGDTVAEFEPIVEVTTDKVDTEIPAPAAGVVLAIYVAEGETVERGTLLAVIGAAGESTSSAPDGHHASGNLHAAHAPEVAAAEVPKSEVEGSKPRFSPVVARMAAEHHLDLTKIKGTGLGGRVTKQDVENFLATPVTTTTIATTLEPWEQPGSGDLFKPTDDIYAQASGKNVKAVAVAPAPPPRPSTSVPSLSSLDDLMKHIPGALVKHSSMRQAIAERMVESKLRTAPHVTTVFEVEMSRVMTHWKANEAEYQKQGVRLTLTAYFVLAIARAALAHPSLNARWLAEGLYVPSVVNVGMAVALQEGLIVPVIRNAQDMNLLGAARAVSDLAARARSKALKPEDTQHGTITLTNHGVSGSLFATPIINQPQSAIVGTGAVTKRVIVVQDAAGSDVIAIRPMMYATLTFDHRVTDGAVGDAFLATFKKTLEEWA